LARYYDGTSAYQLTYDQQPMHTTQSRQSQKAQARARALKRRMRMFVSLIAVFATACTILYGNVIIIQTSSKAERLQEELAAITNANNQKMLDLERSVDLKKVEEIAINELGMMRPEKYQTVYVDVTQTNYAEVSEAPQTDNPGVAGTFGVIRKSIANLLAYFN